MLLLISMNVINICNISVVKRVTKSMLLIQFGKTVAVTVLVLVVKVVVVALLLLIVIVVVMRICSKAGNINFDTFYITTHTNYWQICLPLLYIKWTLHVYLQPTHRWTCVQSCLLQTTYLDVTLSYISTQNENYFVFIHYTTCDTGSIKLVRT